MVKWGISLPGRGDRVTGAIRRKAVNALGVHATDGRLTQAELNERAALVNQAEHNHQIDVLFSDLPQPHPRFSADTNTGLLLPGCFGALMVLITAAVWMTDRGTWVPFAISTGVCLASFTANGIVGTRRVRELRESPHEQQRRRMRAEQYDTDNLRLGHPERVATAETLIVHAAAGLPREEYHSYVDRLPAVRTRGELKSLIGHLPPPDPDLADTVLSPGKEDDRPWGFAVAITWLLIVPGLPLAIATWVKFDQWYWLLVWAGAVFVRYADWRLRKRRRAKKSARRIPGMVN
jgi:hypothetical protein